MGVGHIGVSLKYGPHNEDYSFFGFVLGSTLGSPDTITWVCRDLGAGGFGTLG